jgi:hypothetical protein
LKISGHNTFKRTAGCSNLGFLLVRLVSSSSSSSSSSLLQENVEDSLETFYSMYTLEYENILIRSQDTTGLFTVAL